MSVVTERRKRELSSVREQLRQLTADRRPWPEDLCQKAEHLLLLIRAEEPGYEQGDSR